MSSSHTFSATSFSALNSLPFHDVSNSRSWNFTRSLRDGCNPWPLLQNSPFSGNSRPLRLVVHGSAGGVLDPLFVEFADELSNYRKSEVQVEALTAGSPPCLSSPTTWLVPLLLLPGKHVRSDLPAIKQRLNAGVVSFNSLPFLGSWPSWQLLLESFVSQVRQRNTRPPVLVHHPLAIGVGHRYLTYLSLRLRIPIVSITQWNKDLCGSSTKFLPIPLFLAPNQVTQSLSKLSGIPSLLETNYFRLSLINLLRLLP